jgi:hypothetical protein
MDLYTLGMVLSDHKETYGQAKRLLRLACEYENDPCIKGVAALRVAEISDDLNEQGGCPYVCDSAALAFAGLLVVSGVPLNLVFK